MSLVLHLNILLGLLHYCKISLVYRAGQPSVNLLNNICVNTLMYVIKSGVVTMLISLMSFMSLWCQSHPSQTCLCFTSVKQITGTGIVSLYQYDFLSESLKGKVICLNACIAVQFMEMLMLEICWFCWFRFWLRESKSIWLIVNWLRGSCTASLHY